VTYLSVDSKVDHQRQPLERGDSPRLGRWWWYSPGHQGWEQAGQAKLANRT